MARLRLFASLREVAGQSVVDVPGPTLGDVLRSAAERFGPEFERQVQHCRIILDGEPTQDMTAPTTPDCEVAILPPVAGG